MGVKYIYHFINCFPSLAGKVYVVFITPKKPHIVFNKQSVVKLNHNIIERFKSNSICICVSVYTKGSRYLLNRYGLGYC